MRKLAAFGAAVGLMLGAAGCRSQPQDPLPTGHYIDLRDGACLLHVVTPTAGKSLQATKCADSSRFSAVSPQITMEVPTCGSVTFGAKGGFLNRTTYARDRGFLESCRLNAIEHGDSNVVWIALR